MTGAPGPRPAALGLLTAWAVSRVVLLLLAVADTTTAGDVAYYERWASEALDGQLPEASSRWAYPLPALLPMVLPHALGVEAGAYRMAFAVEMLLLDAAVLALLLRERLRRHGDVAAWTWVACVPALGPVAYQRFDLAPAALAAAALVVAGPRTRVGMLVAGSALKLWPLLLLPLAVTARRAATAMVGVALGVAALLLVGAGHHVTSSLTYQADRGLHLESPAALPLLWLTAAGVDGWAVEFRYGASEVVGPGTGALAATTAAGGLLAVGLLVLVALRRPVEERLPHAFAVVLVLLLTGKSASAQYLLWVVAVGCVLLATLPRRQSLPIGSGLCLAALLTWAYHPFLFGELRGAEPLALVVKSARDVVLVALLVVLVRTGVLRRRDERQPVRL